MQFREGFGSPFFLFAIGEDTKYFYFLKTLEKYSKRLYNKYVVHI